MSHHATEDLAVLRAMPGVTVVAPGDDWEAAEATEAVAATPGTCYLRLDRSSAGVQRNEGEQFTLGRARKLREGTDLTLIATGGMLGEVLAAADRLVADGIGCRVLSMHTVKPLDAIAVLAAARETGGIITVEEHVAEGGLGSAVGEVLLDAGLYPARFRRIAVRGGFVSVVGGQAYLRGTLGLDAGSIVRQAQELLERAP
jgi:transketolase